MTRLRAAARLFVWIWRTALNSLNFWNDETSRNVNESFQQSEFNDRSDFTLQSSFLTLKIIVRQNNPNSSPSYWLYTNLSAASHGLHRQMEFARLSRRQMCWHASSWAVWMCLDDWAKSSHWWCGWKLQKKLVSELLVGISLSERL